MSAAPFRDFLTRAHVSERQRGFEYAAGVLLAHAQTPEEFAQAFARCHAIGHEDPTSQFRLGMLGAALALERLMRAASGNGQALEGALAKAYGARQLTELISPIELAVLRAGSQDKLAQAVCVTQQAISNYVRRGHCPPVIAFRIWRATGVDPTCLVAPELARLMRDYIDRKQARAA